MSQDRVNRLKWDSQRIRALRRHLGLTQRELADRLGTRQQTISEWEKGMYQPRGASSTVLSIVAERDNFKYEATPAQAKQIASPIASRGTKKKKRQSSIPSPSKMNNISLYGAADLLAALFREDKDKIREKFGLPPVEKQPKKP